MTSAISPAAGTIAITAAGPPPARQAASGGSTSRRSNGTRTVRSASATSADSHAMPRTSATTTSSLSSAIVS